MPSKALNADILLEILTHFTMDLSWYPMSGPDDNLLLYPRVRDLHSCALVNRLWCQVAVPFLWRQPFFFWHRNKRRRHHKLIHTCLRCVDGAPEFLRSVGLSPPSSLKPNKHHQRRLPTFDYLGFVRVMTYHSLYNLVYIWLENLPSALHYKWKRRLSTVVACHVRQSSDVDTTPLRPERMRRMAAAVTDRIVACCGNIETVALFGFAWDRLFGSYRVNASPETFESFSSITCLEWTYSHTMAQCLRTLAKQCRSIRKLCIKGPTSQDIVVDKNDADKNDTDGATAELIHAQSQLEELELRNNVVPWLESMEAIQVHARSFRKILFTNALFDKSVSWTSVTQCRQLEHLSFKWCLGLTSSILTPLVKADFPCLRVLDFTYCDLKPTPIETMIENVGAHLDSLLLDGKNTLLSAVTSHCVNLTSLYLHILSNVEDSLHKLLAAVSPRLEYLGLHSMDLDSRADWLFVDVLVRCDFDRLVKLSIETWSKYSGESLGHFLTKTPMPALECMNVLMWRKPTDEHFDELRRFALNHKMNQLRVTCDKSFSIRNKVFKELADAVDFFVFDKFVK